MCSAYLCVKADGVYLEQSLVYSVDTTSPQT